MPLHAIIMTRFRQIWNPGCYSSLTNPHRDWHKKQFQCPHGLELLLIMDGMPVQRIRFNALSGLSCYDMVRKLNAAISKVSMPSRAYTSFLPHGWYRGGHIVRIRFNALSGLYLISTPRKIYMRLLQD